MDSAAFLNFFNIFLASIQLLPLKAFVCMLHPKKKKKKTHSFKCYRRVSVLCQLQIYKSGFFINQGFLLGREEVYGLFCEACETAFHHIQRGCTYKMVQFSEWFYRFSKKLKSLRSLCLSRMECYKDTKRAYFKILQGFTVFGITIG